MKKPLIKLVSLLMVAVFSNSINAEQSACLQHPKRTTPCPHSVYKAVPFKDDANKLVCICLSDFTAFTTKPADDKEAVLQKLERQDMSIHLGLSEQEIIDLLKR